MDFQFNFSLGDFNRTDLETHDCREESSDQRSLPASEEILPEPQLCPEFLESEYEVLKLGKNIAINCLRSRSVEGRLGGLNDDNCIQKTMANHSDLIPNVYEGGLKVWECSLDLVQYLKEARVPLEGLHILDLGCGAGLPGIFALQQNAAQVCFQDFNKEVLNYLTIPNVRLNIGDRDISETCQFISGDWGQIGDDLIASNRFDVILTSETIYNTDSVPSLYTLMKRTLKPEGMILVAAKTHYFGVGGGTRLFEEYIQKQLDFRIEVCKKITEGVQREILQMKYKEKKVSDG
ncbi:Histidine protein methyltransferase 1-like [Holothuria leucospilota]|uniref:protein-histidine N-methyltransferase n=1 Tax=Holothuria leucospilota TaxID=206669 RepID=A0A9Q0YLB8_HOLLE|nr:Histidine protein methyltransferase 1-like [Holothuria leucospilota]